MMNTTSSVSSRVEDYSKRTLFCEDRLRNSEGRKDHLGNKAAICVKKTNAFESYSTISRLVRKSCCEKNPITSRPSRSK
jgi:hypothetical protein